jgi:hypothetical protein
MEGGLGSGSIVMGRGGRRIDLMSVPEVLEEPTDEISRLSVEITIGESNSLLVEGPLSSRAVVREEQG